MIASSGDMNPTLCTACGRPVAPARVHCDGKDICTDCEAKEQS